ncbi:class I SAM-dependent methyltransferase [Micromonospora sp. NPDC005172]|uniref:class I SAM-dependent methyltransferase n=1 Tax=Micromonospora sp. NPDC005172 TaxID=3156867 RepID=UPI00339DAC4E
MPSTERKELAADMAAVAALLEVAEQVGISALLDRAEPFGIDDVMITADIPRPGAETLLQALAASGLLIASEKPGEFSPCPDMADRRYESGYLAWALNANSPFIENSTEFLRDPASAGAHHQRDGRSVAVTSKWIGSQGFYPAVIKEIYARNPSRIVDLGAGAGGLVIHLLQMLPDARGLTLDLSHAACEEAESAAVRAGVLGRMEIVTRSIESLASDPSPIRGAEVIHAGFVMHDIGAKPDVQDAVLRACWTAIEDGGALMITDAVPYVSGRDERAFSALFTYLHAASMGVRLPTEEQWRMALRRAGFKKVECQTLPMPGSRLFIATK